MNPHLQTLLNFIEKAESLSNEGKKKLAASVKDADHDLTVSEFKLEKTEKVKKTTAILLEETIAELEQRRKAVEEQNRELEIEAALERVRGRTMAMQKSEELEEVATIMFDQLGMLGGELWTCGFVLCQQDRPFVECWMSGTTSAGLNNPLFLMPVDLDPYIQAQYDAWKRGDELFMIDIPEENIKMHHERMGTFRTIKTIVEQGQKSDAQRQLPKWQRDHNARFRQGYLVVVTTKPFAEVNLFVRFAKVFEQTYTRFLDLQKAEAQAREAKIETALERVRSRSMAMHKSDELQEVINTVFDQLKDLEIETDTANIGISIEGSKDTESWIQNTERTYSSRIILTYLEQSEISRDLTDGREKAKDYLSKSYSAEEKNIWFNHLFAHSGLKDIPEDRKKFILEASSYTVSQAHMKHAGIGLARYSDKAFSDEENDILKRFVRVFEQAYIRFLDLQKAEAQARESQIQLAMERVRARTMAMQRSRELADTSALLFQQIKSLGVPPWSCGFNIWEQGDKFFTSYMGTPEGAILDAYKIPLTEEATFIHFQESRDSGDKLFIDVLEGETLETHYRYFQTLPGIKEALERRTQAGSPIPTFQINHLANFSHGNLMFITYEPCPEAHDIFIRFAKVFEQTYTRFLDLQKAEAQAREANIEASLEKVRSRSLGMHNSAELRDLAKVVFEQLGELNFGLDGAAFIVTPGDDPTILNIWIGDNEQPYPTCFRLGQYETPSVKDIWKAKESGKDFLSKTYSYEEKNQWFKYAFEHTDLKMLSDQRKNWILEQPYLTQAIAIAKNSMIGIHCHFERILDENEIDILIRFAKVFEQGFVRFIDLQKAEAQAKEAQIQLSLERVRARAMGMHQSGELSDLLTVLFDQFDVLGIRPVYAHLSLIDLATNSFTFRVTGKEGKRVHAKQTIDIKASPVWKEAFDKWKAREFNSISSHRFPPEILPQAWDLFHEIISRIPEESRPEMDDFPDGLYVTEGSCKFGFIGIGHSRESTLEERDIVTRFATEFERSYQRFLDLQNAEAQAREAQIEAALERIRSKTMAMQKQQELQGVMANVFEELQHLGFRVEACSIIIFNKENFDSEYWFAGFSGKGMPRQFHFPYVNHPYFHAQLDPWREGVAYNTVQYSGELKDSMQELFEQHGFYEGVPQEIKQAMKDWDGWHTSNAYMSHGLLGVAADDPLPEDQAKILQRFAKVFEQTYTRFLDLQKAEAQAKEAQIQLALERVRARTMAMQNSIELSEVVGVLYTQLESLNFGIDQVLIAIVNRNLKTFDWWSRGFGVEVQPKCMTVPFINHPLVDWYVSSLENKLDSGFFELTGDLKKSWDEHLFNHTDLKLLPEQVKETMKNIPGIYLSAAFIKHGTIEAAGPQPLTEEQSSILKRFAIVFEQAFTRFLDLQKAEAQAREAQIEAALERVRSRTMAMQRSEELLDVASILFQQVKALGVPQWNCGFNIWDIGDKEFTYYPGSPDGKILPTPCKIPLTEHPVFMRFDESRKRGDELLIYEKQGEEQTDHYHYMLSLPGVGDLLRDMLNAGFELPSFQIDHVANFSYGNLIFITFDHFPEMHDVFKRFAKVFEQTYTRFLDLKKAEAQAKEALIEAALEKVRSRSMAMQKSEELRDVIQVVFDQLVQFISNIDGAGFNVDIRESDDCNLWHTDRYAEFPDKMHVPYFDHPLSNAILEARNSGAEKMELSLTFEEKNMMLDQLFKYVPAPQEAREALYNVPG